MAELLSQLPSEVDVGQLVADSTDVQDEDEERHHHKQRTAPVGLLGALGEHGSNCRATDLCKPPVD